MNEKNPLVSIIIPHYNNYSILEECIQSIYNIKYKTIEIIIVDNNSIDDSISKIQNKFLDIIIYKSNKNLGYAGGCNLGASIAKGEYLFFLNNDTIHKDDCLDHLVDTLNINQNIASVQPKIKNYNQKTMFDYAGASGGFIDFFVYPFCRGRLFNTIEEDNGQYDNSVKVFWTSGTAFLTRKDIFIKLKGFDEKLFSHMEEIDYCWKCYLAGYDCYINTNAIVYHHGAKTLSHESYFKTYLNHRNSMILLLTNYNLALSLFLIPFRIILEILSSILELFKLRIFHFFAHYIAILSLLNILYLFKRRRLINDIRVINDSKLFKNKIIYNHSIVLKYFLFKNIFYKDIK